MANITPNYSIKTKVLKNVEVQENGIIRNEKGRLIARLVDDVDFDSDHIQSSADCVDNTLRSEEVQAKYEAYLKTPASKHCPFCREAKRFENKEKSEIIKDYKFWYVMPNEFHYDKVYKEQHMLFPKRHVKYKHLTNEEMKEYDKLMDEYREQDCQIGINCGKTSSFPDHDHIQIGYKY